MADSWKMTSPSQEPPAPPSPSADAGIAPGTAAHVGDNGHVPPVSDIDVFTLTPVAALKILSNSLEVLVHITGDIPPTPPVNHLPISTLDLAEAESENEARRAQEEKKQKRRSRQWVGDDEDVPVKARTPIGSPEARPTEPIQIVDPEVEPFEAQHAAVIRKFCSKKPPPIALEDYLMRLHRYCPMSTAVYLAAGLYIHRLAVTEKWLPVTKRNVHRLVLAGLRISMKALEDLSYPHSRFAKVGGVTESEMVRLEVSFCFVTGFNLRVTSEMLLDYAKTARDSALLHQIPSGFQPKLPAIKDQRFIVTNYDNPARTPQTETWAAAG